MLTVFDPLSAKICQSHATSARIRSPPYKSLAKLSSPWQSLNLFLLKSQSRILHVPVRPRRGEVPETGFDSLNYLGSAKEKFASVVCPEARLTTIMRLNDPCSGQVDWHVY